MGETNCPASPLAFDSVSSDEDAVENSENLNLNCVADDLTEAGEASNLNQNSTEAGDTNTEVTVTEVTEVVEPDAPASPSATVQDGTGDASDASPCLNLAAILNEMQGSVPRAIPESPDSRAGEFSSPDKAAGGGPSPSIPSRSDSDDSDDNNSLGSRILTSSELVVPSDLEPEDDDPQDHPSPSGGSAPPPQPVCPECVVMDRCSCCGEPLRRRRRRCK